MIFSRSTDGGYSEKRRYNLTPNNALPTTCTARTSARTTDIKCDYCFERRSQGRSVGRPKPTEGATVLQGNDYCE